MKSYRTIIQFLIIYPQNNVEVYKEVNRVILDLSEADDKEYVATTWLRNNNSGINTPIAIIEYKLQIIIINDQTTQSA